MANTAVFGGGIACGNDNSGPTITGCTITANSAKVGGGGIYFTGSDPTIENCIISGNFAPTGGAIYSHNPGNPEITNCTISANTASRSAGGIYCSNSSNLEVTNCILWGNTASTAGEMLVAALGAATTVEISYCDIQNKDTSVVVGSGCTIDWGEGNIDLDPQFTEPGNMNDSRVYLAGDYHLLDTSACIDAGDPAFVAADGATDIDGDLRVLGAKVDMGADEFKLPIPATIRVTPRTLNLTSNGNWISCDISLPDTYEIGDVVVGSIGLNVHVKPERSEINEIQQKLLVKFSRSETQDVLGDAEDSALLTVRGKLQDGTDFKGHDTIKIVRASSKK
jgi:parallel beta-helix repeat protein/predicted outer membrane repeat protein